MNDHNGCRLNPMEIMRKLYRIIIKLRDQKSTPMIEVIYYII
ncbi:putative photosystem I assembly protein Ycf3-like [Iris pallida]|uniref:Photosystem I assembly protein Ycf3-like n=1 Tax=Iris pallida TaxID=29817 RepID=A0AAX6HSI7_IRIPA|nr:putative photosystem I assembly protein Ycf3-like [Iris pallida]